MTWRGQNQGSIVVLLLNGGIGFTSFRAHTLFLFQEPGDLCLPRSDQRWPCSWWHQTAEQERQHIGEKNWTLPVCNLSENLAKDLEEHLDVLLHNAANMQLFSLIQSDRCKVQFHTDDGFEMQFGVNHLGHFLLTHKVSSTGWTRQLRARLSLSSAWHTRKVRYTSEC